MAGTILSTLSNSSVTTTALQENVTEQCGWVHFQQVVAGSPGTSLVVTLNNSQNIGVRAVPVVTIRTSAGVDAYNDYIVLYSATTGAVTIGNGTTFALAQSQVIDICAVTQPIGL